MTANGPHGVAVGGSANLDIVVTPDRNQAWKSLSKVGLRESDPEAGQVSPVGVGT